MRHQLRGRGHRQHRPAGIAVAAACADCADIIGSPEPSPSGIIMGIVHLSHVAELEERGWILTKASDGGPPDIVCRHYHDANWQGEHDDDCCGKRDSSG